MIGSKRNNHKKPEAIIEEIRKTSFVDKKGEAWIGVKKSERYRQIYEMQKRPFLFTLMWLKYK